MALRQLAIWKKNHFKSCIYIIHQNKFPMIKLCKSKILEENNDGLLTLEQEV